jgi:hypothetical protein
VPLKENTRTFHQFHSEKSVHLQFIIKMQPTRCYVSQFFISLKCCTCFRGYLRPSSGAQTVHKASGICQTLLQPAAIMVGIELVSFSEVKNLET